MAWMCVCYGINANNVESLSHTYTHTHRHIDACTLNIEHTNGFGSIHPERWPCDYCECKDDTSSNSQKKSNHNTLNMRE